MPLHEKSISCFTDPRQIVRLVQVRAALAGNSAREFPLSLSLSFEEEEEDFHDNPR